MKNGNKYSVFDEYEKSSLVMFAGKISPYTMSERLSKSHVVECMQLSKLNLLCVAYVAVPRDASRCGLPSPSFVLERTYVSLTTNHVFVFFCFFPPTFVSDCNGSGAQWFRTMTLGVGIMYWLYFISCLVTHCSTSRY